MSTCHFCTRELGSLRDGDACLVNGCHWTGEAYIRVDLCSGCLDAGRLAKAPRKPRKPRQAPQYAATDWNQLVAFSRKH